MAVYFGLILAFVGLLWWYNAARQKRLDADPAQQELARLLVKASTSPDDAARQAVTAHLARTGKSGADRRVRLTHAVMLVRSEAAPDLYEKVLMLSRQL
ncbi:MAG TPA: hypothetical protein PK680_09985 [Novosphingobium sp.]|nr:hypothetical protein [Novosphingobium sp.]HQA18699.1 hypothetical protein [Novosphingobium sp.]